MRRVRCLLFSVVAIAATSTTAFAQAGGSHPLDISGGYAFVADPEVSFPFGFYVDGAYNVTSAFAVVFDVTHSSKTISELDDVDFGTDVDFGLTAYLFGGRYVNRQNARATWFAQALIGPGHLSANVPDARDLIGFDISVGTTETVFQFGGGVVVPLSSNGVGFRVGADYRHFDANEFRLTAGVSVPVGHR